MWSLPYLTLRNSHFDSEQTLSPSPSILGSPVKDLERSDVVWEKGGGPYGIYSKDEQGHLLAS